METLLAFIMGVVFTLIVITGFRKKIYKSLNLKPYTEKEGGDYDKIKDYDNR